MIGIIGGTGLYQIEGLEVVQTKTVETPFGFPSAPLILGHLGKEKVVFLPRHGSRHQLLPSEINFRANIWALKSLGVRQVLSISAVGSLEKKIVPGDFAMPNQYFDWTKGRRIHTFFGDGIVAHISTAEPACPSLMKKLENTSENLGYKLHTGKIYACVEGPRLGTRAESHFLKNSGCHLVGMTNIPEAFLAREAQLCYVTLAVATDYDCWLEDPVHHVTTEQILKLYKESLEKVKILIKKFVSGTKNSTSCSCRESLKGALVTSVSELGEEKKKILNFLME
ncbi:MAG: S-methyl-5'-thioadenosine phosphorylase [Deltaproteobacteria bacterium]|nr:S-methyl-5'-thioadenosine phosphorylase [Deltaproteobacteria bacterium]